MCWIVLYTLSTILCLRVNQSAYEQITGSARQIIHTMYYVVFHALHLYLLFNGMIRT